MSNNNGNLLKTKEMGDVVARDAPGSIVGKLNEIIPVSINATNLKDENGKKVGMIVVTKDLRLLREYAKSRLSKITPILKKVASGDFSEKIVVPKESDEFTEHLASLEKMTEDFEKTVMEIREKSENMEVQKKALENSYAELEKTKASLEEKVKERTNELERVNISLEEKVKERTNELEESKKNLEKEVSSRTRELQNKLTELELFNKVAVGRELKMVELKEEIAKLQGRLTGASVK